MRGLLLLLLPLFACGETLEDAARALAKQIATHLAQGETAQVTSRNLTTLTGTDVAKAQAAFERALRRRVRNPMPAEIALTFSENLKGYLLVAEIRDRAVEMVSFRPETPAAPARSAMTVEKKLLWSQDAPVLDLMTIGDEMLVLDTSAVTRYERRDGKWTRAESAGTNAEPVRDPRGRMEVSGDAVTVALPGMTCRGTRQPLALRCEEGGEFSAGRNTIESEGWPAHYARAQIEDATLIGEIDGRTHIYDSSRNAGGAFDEWGSDFAAASTCAGPRIAAASSSDRESNDSVALYTLVNRVPVRASDPVEFPGPVTALWPSPGGVLVVARNLVTGGYEAYSLTVDCNR